MVMLVPVLFFGEQVAAVMGFLWMMFPCALERAGRLL
jgi:hypothetical protein